MFQYVFEGKGEFFFSLGITAGIRTGSMGMERHGLTVRTAGFSRSPLDGCGFNSAGTGMERHDLTVWTAGFSRSPLDGCGLN